MEIAASQPQIQTKTTLYYLAVACGLLAVLYATNAFPEYESSHIIAVGFLALLQLSPLVLALTNQRMNYVALVLAAHFNFYTLNSKILRHFVLAETSLPPISFISVQEHIICTLLLLVGYGIVKKRASSKPAGDLQLLELPTQGYFFAVSYPFFYETLAGFLPPSFHAITATSPLVSIVIAASSTCRGGKVPTAIGKILLFSGGVIVFIKQGYFANLGIAVLLTVCGSLATRNYKEILIALPAVAFIFTVQPVKGDYRAAVWNGYASNYSPMERLDLLSELLATKAEMLAVGQELIDSGQIEESEEANAALARMSDDSMEIILEMTPERVPFWNGETYASLLFLPVPRFIYPDKPTKDFNNKFGRMYGIIAEDDYMTQIAINTFGEGYMNFGYPGMYGVAVFLGAWLAFLEGLSASLLGAPFLFTFLALIKPYLAIEADLAHSMGETAIMLGLLFLLRRFLKKR